jgi:hypothetical protein
VTSVDEMSKLKALRRARERLESALATDKGWQALLRCSATAGAEAGEIARLEAGLLRSNPLYRAWMNVNAAIEARQRSGPIDASGATAPRPSTSSSDLDPGLARRQRNDDDARGAGPRGLARQSPPSEEEASVSFVALTPLLAPSNGRQPQRSAALPAPSGLPARQGHEPPESGAPPGVQDWGGEEAEVSVVSVDARRHAGAVDRLLRALRGETNAS